MPRHIKNADDYHSWLEDEAGIKYLYEIIELKKLFSMCWILCPRNLFDMLQEDEEEEKRRIPT